MRGQDRGAILVEALVACAVIALVAGALFALVGGRSGSLAERREALLIAQSRLATLGVTQPLTPGLSSGRSGRHIWSVQVSRHGGSRLVDVSVAVRRADGRELVRLDSLRLVSAR
jgi:hypothetical protein